jgi:hypothetical protein
MTQICHYTSASNAIQILSSKTFKFGHLENSNDPFENLKKRYSISYTIPNSLQLLMENIFDYANKKLSYASFEFENKLIPYGEHWTMWSHYGKLHTGVCLVFDQSALLNEITTKKKKFEESKIIYTNNLLINPIHFENRSDRSASTILSEFKEFLLFSKHIGWLPENEYRIVVFARIFEIPIKNCLKKIIYGPEINNKNQARLDSLLKKINFTGSSGKLEYALGAYAKPSHFLFHDLKTYNSANH